MSYIAPFALALTLPLVLAGLAEAQANAPDAAPTVAENEPYTIGFTRTVASKVLGEERELIVSLPDGHEGGEGQFPVVYLLDPRTHFVHTVGLLRFKQLCGQAPPVIVVGIKNTDRTRDMTPPTEEEGPMTDSAGGVDDFLRFMRDELFPLMEQEYRASSHRTLIGHSLGGLTALHCLVHQPADFTNYLAISPSLWWDGQRLVGQAADALDGADLGARRLFMTLGDEGGAMHGGVRRMQAILTEENAAGLVWDSLVMPDENHMSVASRSSLLGVEFLFADWALESATTDYLDGGWDAVQAGARSLQARYGCPKRLDQGAVQSITSELMERGRHDEVLAVLDTAPESIPIPPMAYEFIGAEMPTAALQRQFVRRAVELSPGSDSLRQKLADLGGDPDSIPRPTQIEVARLQAAAGRYEGKAESGDARVDITHADGKLELDISGGPKGDLVHVEGNRFNAFGGQVDLELRFDDSGAVEAVWLKTPFKGEMVLARVAE